MNKPLEHRNINNLTTKNKGCRDETLKCEIEINGKAVEAVVDTGVDFSVIFEELAKELKVIINISEESSLTLVNNVSTYSPYT